MKTTLLFLMVTLSAVSFGQKLVYCEIVGREWAGSTVQNPERKMVMYLDFGQIEPIPEFYQNYKFQYDKKISTLESMVDALNYMTSEGWEFVSSNVYQKGGQGLFAFSVYKYLMVKKF